MYKMVTGSVAELEKLLNDAAAEGFTDICREFPEYAAGGPDEVAIVAPPEAAAVGAVVDAPIRLHMPSIKYSFLLRKPPLSEVEPIFGMLRDLAKSMGVPFAPAAIGKLIKLDGGRDVDGPPASPAP